MKRAIVLLVLLVFCQVSLGKSQEDDIRTTINGYIVGTSYNYPERILASFMPRADMFLDYKDSPLFVMKVEEYAERVGRQERGKFNGRVTNILSIERFEGIATAKLEVIIPSMKKRFVDMLLLKRLEDGWKIISKTAGSEASERHGRKALLILRGKTEDVKTNSFGEISFNDIVVAFDKHYQAGYHVELASPEGGTPAIQNITASDSLQAHYLFDKDFMYALRNTLKLVDVDQDEYEIVHPVRD